MRYIIVGVQVTFTAVCCFLGWHRWKYSRMIFSDKDVEARHCKCCSRREKIKTTDHSSGWDAGWYWEKW